MPSPNPPGPTPPHKAGIAAIERLYVYWLVSTALLLLATLFLALMTRGALERVAAAQRELAERLAKLEDLAPAREVELQSPPAAPRAPEAPSAAPRPSATEPAGADAAPPPGTRAAASAPGAPADIEAQLEALLPLDATLPGDVRDPAAAERLLEMAERARSAPWRGTTWTRLAVLAQLLGQERRAEALAARARALRTAPLEYEAVAARSLLLRGQPAEALGHAEDLAGDAPAAPQAAVLVAAALLGMGDPAAADEAAATVTRVEDLAAIDRVLLGRVLLGLERWSALRAWRRAEFDVPRELAAEHQFVTAASLAQEGRTVEALAILDGLLAEARPEASTAPAGWSAPRPTRYELELWRGITLMYAQQAEAARQALLQAAAVDPGRPEAHYHLGIVEARAGRRDAAANHLKNALAASAQMAPAWEALAILELDGDARGVQRALEYLERAIDAHPRRASSHFLAAVAHAKLSDAGAAGEALRRAIALDPALLAEAQQSDAFTRLLTPAELEQLAAGAGEAGVTAAGTQPGASPDGE